MIHHDSNVEEGQPHDWWIYTPENDKQANGVERMTGYRLLNDPVLENICKDMDDK